MPDSLALKLYLFVSDHHIVLLYCMGVRSRVYSMCAIHEISVFIPHGANFRVLFQTRREVTGNWKKLQLTVVHQTCSFCQDGEHKHWTLELRHSECQHDKMYNWNDYYTYKSIDYNNKKKIPKAKVTPSSGFPYFQIKNIKACLCMEVQASPAKKK